MQISVRRAYGLGWQRSANSLVVRTIVVECACGADY